MTCRRLTRPGGALLGLAALAACSGGARARGEIFGLPPGARTQAVLVGELCERGEPCACRDESATGTGGVSGPGARVRNADEVAADALALSPAAPAKATEPKAEASVRRLELRLRSSHELWLRVGPWTFLKDRERAEACFYIDVPVPSGGGDAYPVELRASNPDGISAGLSISELGEAADTWYRTLAWSCGAPGACSFDELDAQRAESARAAAEHRLYDPCGSLQVLGLSWDSRVAPDHQHPGDLTLRFSLQPTARVPDKVAGDPTCGF